MPDLDMNTHARELEARVATLEELLGTLERTFVEQSERLERSREAEAHFAAIVQGADMAIISISLDLHFLTWNAAAERLFGYTQEEIIGRQPAELFGQTVGKHALAEFFKGFEARRGPTPRARYSGETFRRKDGSLIEVVLIASGIYDADSQLTGVAFFVRDGADRRRAEREQAALATIVNASQDAIIGFSKDIKITSWNPAAEAFYGFAAKEAIGRDITDMVRLEREQASLVTIVDASEDIILSVSTELRIISWNPAAE